MIYKIKKGVMKQVVQKLFFVFSFIFFSNVFCKNVIVVGASTGIGRATAKEFAKRGYNVGIAARKIDLLESLKKDLKEEHPNVNICVKQLDVTQTQIARESIVSLPRFTVITRTMIATPIAASGSPRGKPNPAKISPTNTTLELSISELK